MLTRLVKVSLQPGAKGPARGHRNLGLQHSRQRVFARLRFTEVLHNLPFSVRIHTVSDQ